MEHKIEKSIQEGSPIFDKAYPTLGDFYLEITGAKQLTNLHNLTNINHWNLAGLSHEQRNFNGDLEVKYRKPRVRLVLSQTTKGNLALRWYPHCINNETYWELKSTDFFQFSDERDRRGYPSSPWNQLFLIKGYQRQTYSTSLRHSAATDIWEYLQSTLCEIRDFLSEMVEITLQNDLVIEHDTEKLFNRKITSVNILTVEEIKNRNKQREFDHWINEKIINGLGINLDEFINTYIENQDSMTVASKVLLSKITTNTKMRTDKYRAYLKKLQSFNIPEINERLSGSKLFPESKKKTAEILNFKIRDNE